MASAGGATKVKEDLSRMQAAYGAKMVGKLKQLNMIVLGLDGLGVETAKNLLLTGPGALTVHDDTVVTTADLGVNFYLTQEDVGKKTRADACAEELKSINPNVNFNVAKGEVTTDTLAGFNVAIFTDNRPKDQLVAFSEYCHANKIAFIYATTTGLFSTVFTDFGEKHEVFDKTGEPERTFPIESVYISETSGLVEITLDSDEIKLVDDDGHIEITNVQGMTEINGAMVQVKVDPKNKYCLSVHKFFARDSATADWKEQGDGAAFAEKVKNFTSYDAGGVVKTVKVPEFYDYAPLGASLTAPVFCQNHMDFTKGFFGGMGFDNLHATRRTLLEFQNANDGQLPKLHDEADVKQCIEKFAPTCFAGDVNTEMVTKAALFARTRHNGMCAFLGGIVAQEAMKHTGKYTPLQQWLHFDNLEILSTSVNDDMKLDPSAPSRYDHNIALFGRQYQDKVFSLKVFLVGCGALGCEYLKNLALMGVGCGPEGTKGEVHITDDDIIELSNLSRQFLFRRHHVKTLKSESAGAVALNMNPDLKKGLRVHKTRVEPKTETEFTDEFWEDVSFVVNALDNVKARTYTDSKCLLHSTPLFESGTLATQASLSVHLPGKSDHYHDSGTGGGAIAMCTLTMFPYLSSHCVGWAKNMFRDLFEVGAGFYNKLQKDAAAFIRNVGSASPDEQKEMIKSTLAWSKYAQIPTLSDRAAQIAAVTRVGAEAYDNFFDKAIRKLTHAFPKDLGQPGGKPNIDEKTKVDLGPFWRGRKRFPRPASDRSSARFTSFVFHTACIVSDVLGIERPSEAEVVTVATSLPYEPWTPEAVEEEESIESLVEKLYTISTTGKPVQEMEFEKDEDDNHHIDWIAAACNERSFNYHIDDSTPDYVRVTAGNILAAIATATASVCGVQMLEITKHILDIPATQRKGLTMDLSTCNFFFEDLPDVVVFKERKVVEDLATGVEVLHKVPTKEGFSVWDTIKIHGGARMTGSQLAAHIKGLFSDVVTREVYASSKSLWNAASASSSEPTLEKAFKDVMQSGKSASHSVKTIKRVRNEIKDLVSNPIEGVDVFVDDSDIFNLHLLIKGPKGSPYEAGLFRAHVAVPGKYPLEAPKLTFKTEIFHCNITTAGAPCPNLLYGAEWSPKKNIRFMIVQVLELLLEQSPADSLNSKAGQLYSSNAEEFAKVASKFTAARANPEAERALSEAARREVAQAAAQAKKETPTEAFVWPHNYIVLEGEFDSASDPAAVYDMPRIQLFLDEPAATASESAGEKPPKPTPLPEDSALAKAILATTFEIEDCEFTPKQVYHMSDERAALYLKACKLEPGFTVAVVCEDEDEDPAEVVLLIPDGEAAIAGASPGLSEDHYTILTQTDLIMAEETSVSTCIEYRFGPDDTWTLVPTSADNMENFRSMKFDIFEKSVRTVPVPCMKSLSRMLANGPVDRLYDPNFLNPDREAWQVVNEDNGKVTDIPRPVTEMRQWNCETQSYDDFDTRLVGAPAEGEDARKWFVDVITYVKKNLGGQNTNLSIAKMWSDELNEKMNQLGFKNAWTDLVLSLQPSEEWGLEDE